MRELKTRKEISDWLTQRLQAIPECSDAKVSVQYQLLAPDADGCNWNRDVVFNFGMSDPDTVRERVLPIYEEARRRFNVSEP